MRVHGGGAGGMLPGRGDGGAGGIVARRHRSSCRFSHADSPRGKPWRLPTCTSLLWPICRFRLIFTIIKQTIPYPVVPSFIKMEHDLLWSLAIFNIVSRIQFWSVLVLEDLLLIIKEGLLEFQIVFLEGHILLTFRVVHCLL